jgi:hypothetical protein
MGRLLLHNAWVQLYLLYVGALWIYFIWDACVPRGNPRRISRRPDGTWVKRGRTQPKEAIHGGASRSPLHR